MLLQACRRAQLPLKHTEGFSPHPKVVFASALPVGVAGYRELVDLWLIKPVKPALLKTLLNSKLPASLFKVSHCQTVVSDEPSLTKQLKEAKYQIIARGVSEQVWQQFLQLLPSELKVSKHIISKKVLFCRLPLNFSIKKVVTAFPVGGNTELFLRVDRLELM